MIIGVDPGVGGAIAFLTDKGEFLSVHDMLLRQIMVGDRKRNEVDTIALDDSMYEVFRGLSGEDTRLCIESQFIARKQSERIDPHSIMRLGEVRGIIRGIMEPKFGRAVFVSPSVWKRRLNVPKDKRAALDIARRLFPQAPLKLQKHHNRGEALLIARFLYEFGPP